MTSLTLTCIGRQQNTHDVVSWQLAPLSSSLPPVLAGQCITLHTEIDGQPECRAYTLSSSPQDACWQVTIKDVGRVSHHLHQTLQVGDKIRWSVRRFQPDQPPLQTATALERWFRHHPHVGHVAGRAGQTAGCRYSLYP